MSIQERQPTRVSLSLGSTTRLNEFDFSKISLSLDRDLVPAENPIDAYRDIKALLERMVTEFQAGKPPQMSHRLDNSSPNTSTMKPKESVPVGHNQVSVDTPLYADTILPVSPRPAASKLATLQERLGSRSESRYSIPRDSISLSVANSCAALIE
jgi:hypothetical protein